MPNTDKLVINTGPILALIAALGDLTILSLLYKDVLVPLEVSQEILHGGPTGFGVAEFNEASWLRVWTSSLEIAPILANSLDRGEAEVIQLALNENIKTVCIDEPAGRRVARLSNLSVTGSIGILLRAKQEGHDFSMESAIQRMKQRGIWLSQRVIDFALTQAGDEAE